MAYITKKHKRELGVRMTAKPGKGKKMRSEVDADGPYVLTIDFNSQEDLLEAIFNINPAIK